MNFATLEGKEVIYYSSLRLRAQEKEGIKAYVASCDYDIGVTIMAREEKDRYLLCGVGPFSKQGKDLLSWNPKAFKNWEENFNHVVEGILSGIVTPPLISIRGMLQQKPVLLDNEKLVLRKAMQYNRGVTYNLTPFIFKRKE